MDALHTFWADVPKEHLIPLLTRQAVKGEKSMVAKVCLEKGCIVKIHHHESEQVSVMVTGRARWTVGSNSSNEFREFEMVAGEVLVLPSNTPHGLEVLEDAEFIDILSPIGPMGVDTQKD